MGSEEKILIIDDDPQLRGTLSGILKVKGYRPLTAPTGKTGLKKIQQEWPAVALIDLKLEDMAGMDVLKKARELSPGTECIILTGNASQPSAIEAVNLGAFHYIQKPYDMDHLLVTIRRAIEKKKIEEAQRKSEEIYRAIFETTGTATTIIEEDMTLSLINSEAEKLFGYSKEEIEGTKKWTEFVVKEDLDRMKEYHHLRRIKADLAPKNYEFRFLDRYGNIKHIFLTIAMIPGTKRSVASLLNITERKKAEEQLRLLSSAVEQTTEGIALVDLDGNLLFANDAFAVMHGYTPQELIGKHLSIFHTKDQMPSVDAANQKIKQTGEFSGEIWHVKRDGTVFPTLMHNSLLRDKNGKPTGMIGTLRDITERKRAEEALRESEERYRAIVESSHAGILIVGEDYKFTYVNDTLCGILGRRREEIIGYDFREFLDEESKELVADRYVRRQRGEKVPPRYEFNIVRKDGEKKRVEISSTIVRDSKGGIRTIAQILDITERKRAEQRLEESERELRSLAAHLQSAREKERSMIAREMHDELGQDLTALRMDLAWLGKHLPKKDEALMEKKETMVRQVEGLTKTIKDLSSKLRPGFLDELGLAGAMEMHAEEFEEKTGIPCRLTIKARDLKLDWERSTALFRIFQEALTNVARHAQATEVKCRFEERGGKVVLTLRDNGKGISEKHVMAPDSYGIMGMRERVDYFGGHILIQGARNRGTTIAVEIPFSGAGEE